jgi:hypothetical protein
VDFIDPDIKQWRDGLVSKTFLENEALVIKAIPISPLPVKDRLIW